MPLYSQHPGQRDGRGVSEDLWGDCARDSIAQGGNYGFAVDDDFMDLPTGKYTATQATAGTFAAGTADEGGTALADCNSTTVTQGINVQLNSALFKPQANADIWFEARVKAADIATGPEFALGLANIDTTVIASSAVSTTDHVMFTSVTDNGILLGSSEKAGTAASSNAVHTLVEDTWVRLGFKISGVDKVEWYVNGVKDATTVATANVPIVVLVPTLVCQSDGTTDSIVHIDWWSIYQSKR